MPRAALGVVTIAIAIAVANALGVSAVSSPFGIRVDLTFSGRLIKDSSLNPQQDIADQLLFTIGELNSYSGGARPGRAQIFDVASKRAGATVEITYRAVVPAIWNSGVRLPSSLSLTLPLDISSAGLRRFSETYGSTCVEFGAHDVDAETMFLVYRPRRPGCNIARRDAERVQAVISPNISQTTGKFPEYDKVWADGALNVIAIFGKYDTGATNASDAGISGYNTFVASMKTELASHSPATTPSPLPANPGVGAPDVEFRAVLPGGKRVNVVALLVDNAGAMLQDATTRARYASLSRHADLIVYNGHAGLGAELRRFSSAGRWVAGQYAIVFVNSPVSWSLADERLIELRTGLNADDPKGFKYLDVVTNAMPVFFSFMPRATMAMFRGLASVDNPKTYHQILQAIGGDQLPLVTGEHDNTFTSGNQPTTPWAGLNESGTIARGASLQWTTPVLAPGRYSFATSGTGDVDLYVRIGSAPTTTAFDCRPAKNGPVESCEVQMVQSRAVHLMVRGFAPTSNFSIIGRRVD